jgi:hypothetical protein
MYGLQCVMVEMGVARRGAALVRGTGLTQIGRILIVHRFDREPEVHLFRNPNRRKREQSDSFTVHNGP